ncbi:type VII secretion integral membrane protein EccD [Jatrophihabitans fulvus]
MVASSCRLTIISSSLRVDLAVPMQLSVAELLTIVVSSLGRETADQGMAEGGWLLQRAGEAPFDPGTSLSAAGIRDGDTLHLRTRSSHLPEVAFDDVLDAVAAGVNERTARWRPEHTMRAAAGMASALLVLSLLLLLTTGPGWIPAMAAAATTAVLLLATAAAVARIYNRRTPASVAAGFAVAFAGVAGGVGVGADHSLVEFGAPQVLVASAAVVLAAVLSLALTGAGFAGFVVVMTTGVLTAIGTTVATATTLTPAATASIVATVALAVSPFLPALSFRLSRLPLPQIPQDAADLRRETGVADSRQILGQAVRADQFLTGLVGGVALAIAGAAVLISGEGVTERILAIVLGLICLLRARLFTGRAQRTLLLIAGSLALLAVLVSAVLDASGTGRILAFAAPSVIVAVLLVAAAVGLPGRRYNPPVGRAADIVESLLVLSVIPLALAVMGVYGAARGLPSP